jgi:hypothetical protein
LLTHVPGGSGGTIRISAAFITGSGTIQANGGAPFLPFLVFVSSAFSETRP